MRLEQELSYKKMFKQKETCDSETLTIKTDPNQRVIW